MANGFMIFLPIAASDMDMVIGVIAVIVWIASQVLARKKSGTAPGPESPTPIAEPQDELRKFFQEMEKTVKPREEPQPAAPPPPPPPQRSVVHPKRERPAHRTRTHEEPHAPPLIFTEPVFATPAPVFASPDTVPRLSVSAAVIPTSIYSPMAAELHDPVALRKMIVTMEVLGKPIALRDSRL